MSSALPERLLLLTCGNPARGDDGVGPLLHARLQQRLRRQPPSLAVELIGVVQLQVEQALALRPGDWVIFIDAAVDCAGVTLEPVMAVRDASYTSHALTPQALLEVYRRLSHQPPPLAWALGIPASRFELGQPPSATAQRYLEEAWSLLEVLLQSPGILRQAAGAQG